MEWQWRIGISEIQTRRPPNGTQHAESSSLGRCIALVGIGGRGESSPHARPARWALLDGDAHRYDEQGAVRCAGDRCRAVWAMEITEQLLAVAFNLTGVLESIKGPAC